MTLTNFNHGCSMCYNCHRSCTTCPSGSCEISGNKYENLKRINKQVSMSSSQSLLHKKTLYVSQMVGESADPSKCLQSGGPGDLWRSVQKCSISNTYRLPNRLARTAYKNNKGVDKKHDSYARFLARKVGGVLRKEPYTYRSSSSFLLSGCFKKCNNRVPLTKKGCGPELNSQCTGCGNLSVKHPGVVTCKQKCITRKEPTNNSVDKPCQGV